MTNPAIRRETYLDWNATAPIRPEAAAAITEALAEWGNPSSVHRRGRLARQRIEAAREAVAALVGAPPEGVIFTSGGTEANHLALLGSGRQRVLVSAVEHHSVLDAVPSAERIPVDRNGVIDLNWLDAALADRGSPALVSVMLANNETGVLQPVGEVAAFARKHGALFHCDAVQAAGKLALSLERLGADLVSVSCHKLGGPPGIGALLVTRDADVMPLFRGGGQERGRRAGTENLPGILGFAAAAEAATRDLAAWDKVAGLRDALEAALPPDAVIVGGEMPRLPNTSSIAMPGVSAETQIIALDLAGVMVSAGAACSSGKVGPSHVLEAMGLAPEIVHSTIRVSLGWQTSEADIDHFLEAWTTLLHRHRSSREARAA